MRRLFFLLGLLSLNGTFFGQEESTFNGTPVTEYILEAQPEVVLFTTEERVYLRSEHIHITEAGLFVGQDHIAIPFLLSDASGCYLPLGSMHRKKHTGYWICWNQECELYGRVVHGTSVRCPECNKIRTPG